MITFADLPAWERQLSPAPAPARGPSGCAAVIDAIDLATGEAAPVYDSATNRTGCCTSRAATAAKPSARPARRCTKRDARQLVRAGLAGGKGVPESVAAHPCVFATLTAPSFGPVHARRMRGKTVLPCRPRRDANDRRCPHGRDISCPVRHAETDPRLGRPLCADCYDYEAAVLFNFHAGTLFKRFTTYLPRHLARLAGVTRKRLRAELAHPLRQGRRIPGTRRHPLPRRDPPRRPRQPATPCPRPGTPPRCLCDAITLAARAVRIDAPTGPGRPRVRLGFGPQTQSRPHLAPASCRIRTAARRRRGSQLHRQVRHQEHRRARPARHPDTRTPPRSARCAAPAHHKRMIATAWQLGSAQATGDARLRLWAHTLGYGGHFLTKSRRYSVTFGQLRRARAEHRRLERYGDDDGVRDPWGRPLDDTIVLVVNNWTYAGSGYAPRTPGAELALASAARAREHDRPATDMIPASPTEGGHRHDRNQRPAHRR